MQGQNARCQRLELARSALAACWDQTRTVQIVVLLEGAATEDKRLCEGGEVLNGVVALRLWRRRAQRARAL